MGKINSTFVSFHVLWQTPAQGDLPAAGAGTKIIQYKSGSPPLSYINRMAQKPFYATVFIAEL